MYFGKYEVPQEIIRLKELEQQLKEKNLTLESLLLRLESDYYYYSITPYDLIPFASTGGDGIHFGFLTEFGEISNLSEAPIVCVTPTNDPPIRLVANNIQDFLRLAINVPHMECLEEWWNYKTEEQLTNWKKDYEEYRDVENEATIKVLQEELQNAFHLEPLEYIPYLNEVKEQRLNQIKTSTLDGLGIKTLLEESVTNKYNFVFPFSPEFLDEMKVYLESANTMEKLAFLRDVNYMYLVSPTENNGLYELVIEQLEQLKLADEANRLKVRVI